MIEYLQNALKRKLLTKFLSLEEQKILEASPFYYRYSDIGSERKRAYISKQPIDDDDFNIAVLKVNYNKKFYNLTHPMVLGAITGVGITRECVGDIIITDEIYVVIISEMVSYLINNLTKIDKAHVSLELVDKNIIRDIEVDNYITKNIIVSSMRLDVIVSTITNYSREKAKLYIIQKNVKVNGVINTSVDHLINIGDLISIHRFGRTIILDDVRKTKKDKHVLLIKKTK